MSTKELKLTLTQIIEQINDEKVLEAYYEILKNVLKIQGNQPVGYDSSGNRLTGVELEKRIIEARKRIEAGQSISDKDLKADSENW